MSGPNIVSCSFFPRYKIIRGVPIVQEATRRVLWDNGTISMTVISAAAYEDATGAEVDALCVALDSHPRERR